MKNILTSVLLFLSVQAFSQQIPISVNIPIQNIVQEAPVWCWAAVAQQIILASQGPINTPSQCALVAMANGVNPNFCCSGNGNPSCVRTGSLQQIQHLVGKFGGSYSSLQPPTNPMILYNTLASGRPIILQVKTGITTAHVVVLTGMSFKINNYGVVEPILHINDPMAHFSQQIAFSRLMPIWLSAIVIG